MRNLSILVGVLFADVVLLGEPVDDRAFVGSCFKEGELGIVHQHIEVGGLLGIGRAADRKAEAALVGDVDYLAEIVRENAVLNSLVHTVEDIVNAHLVAVAEENAYLIVGL